VSNHEKPKATYEQAIAIDNARLGQSFKVIVFYGVIYALIEEGVVRRLNLEEKKYG